MRKAHIKSDPVVPINALVIGDSKDKIQDSLWHMAHEPYSVGQHVKSDPVVPINTLVIRDSKDKIKDSLWHDMAHEPYSVGQHVCLTNMLVNVYEDVVSLNSSKDSTVTVSK